MEKKMMGSSLWVFGLVMLLLSANCVHAITCLEALTTLIPCQSFLMGTGGSTPSVACCQNVATLRAKADTTEARKTLCVCFKNAAKAMVGIDLGKAKNLPSLCNVETPVPIDPNVNCDSIQ